MRWRCPCISVQWIRRAGATGDVGAQLARGHRIAGRKSYLGASFNAGARTDVGARRRPAGIVRDRDSGTAGPACASPAGGTHRTYPNSTTAHGGTNPGSRDSIAAAAGDGLDDPHPGLSLIRAAPGARQCR